MTLEGIKGDVSRVRRRKGRKEAGEQQGMVVGEPMSR
jgi:hypothetical protein